MLMEELLLWIWREASRLCHKRIMKKERENESTYGKPGRVTHNTSPTEKMHAERK